MGELEKNLEINRWRGGGLFGTHSRVKLWRKIEENHKEKSHVTKAFKKYLPFIFNEDNALKINFKNKVLLVVPKI